MTDNLCQLAEAAKAKSDGPIDWDALVEQAIKSCQMLMRLGDALYTVDMDSIWEQYARELCGVELTTAEKQQALHNAVLEKGQEAMGAKSDQLVE